MSNTETIDRLCSIVTELSELCRKQAHVIAQSDVECKELADMQNNVNKEIDALEYNMRQSLRYGDITGFDDAEVVYEDKNADGMRDNFDTAYTDIHGDMPHIRDRK